MKHLLKLVLVLSLFLAMAGLATALVNCYDTAHTASETDCEANSECTWRVTSARSWCEQKGCWNYWDQITCEQANNASSSNFINKSCDWKSMNSGWCTNLDCWAFDGNENACLTANTTYSIECSWDVTFDQWSSPCSGPPEKGCWNQRNQSSCQNITGCEWGRCSRKSCWDYSSTTAATCQSHKGFNGKSCQWKTYTWGTECVERGCWSLGNKTGCELENCTWSGSYCTEKMCGDYGGTSANSCENNTAGLKCSWDASGTGWCNPSGCWSQNTQPNCQNVTGCLWETYSGGWCEEEGCWLFTGVGGINKTLCQNSTRHPGVNCTWDNTTGEGWCYENVAAKTCSQNTNKVDCVDTFYCFWNISSGACQEPVAGSIGGDFTEWNPGCYIFDSDRTLCDNTTMCSWDNVTNAKCVYNASDFGYEPTLFAGWNGEQLNCTFIQNKTVCNSIPAFSTCCKWQESGGCVKDRFDQSCRKQMEEPPEGAYYCEDYIAYTDNTTCNKIAGDPWFMPCYWNTTNSRCQFKGADIFAGREENIMLIDNERNCIAAGGSWLKDTYPSTNDNNTAVQLSLGRCDFSFDAERNCDVECYACEFKSDKTNYSSEKNAKDACAGSKLGICEFVGFGSVQDGKGRWGVCKPKEAFKKGLIAGDCKTDCGACTYMGDPAADPKFNGGYPTYETCKAPSCYCTNSPAKCKWIADPSHADDESYGRCGQGSEKTCADQCDKCYSDSVCVNEGGKKGNASAEKAAVCEWKNGLCQYKSGADQLEICWDGTDNNGNNKIDCADSMCYSDPFCGGGFMFAGFGVDCFVYNNNQSSCEAAGCAWVNENWGSWCDMPGAVCWKKDGNESGCVADGNCTWHTGFGGFCEQDWNMGTSNTCMSYNKTTCEEATGLANNCTWTVDDWCTGSVSGGMCNHNPAYEGSGWTDCSSYGSSASVCNTTGSPDSGGDYPCIWQVDNWCQQQGANAGWCEHMSFGCMGFNQTECTENTNATYNHSVWCAWKSDPYTPNGGWCDSKLSAGGTGSCWEKTTELLCNATSGCSWTNGLCDPKGFGGEMTAGGMAGATGAGMGGAGMSCKQYDGNQTACIAQTGCGWFNEPWPSCNVNFNSNCPQYTYNRTTACENITKTQERCKWNTVSNFCDEEPMECYWNTSLSLDSAACNNTKKCFFDVFKNICQPRSFNATTIAICQGYNATLFRWTTGWCNPKMAAQFFGGMMMDTPPIPLGTDLSDADVINEVDIIDFGLKDMGNAYGFGIRVVDLTNSSACNGITLSSGTSGLGKNTSKYYWYLDTDADATNNCNATHNSSLHGFEFKLQNQWSYDGTSGSVAEAPKVYRCSSGSWVLAEIKVSSERNMMCGKIGAAMVAVQMPDLEKFPALYTPGVDIRVTVATADVNGNDTTVTDQASPGWATPGAYDFDVDSFNMYKKEDDATKRAGKEGADKGYVDYGSDADCWTQSGCSNYTCKGHPYCAEHNYGVDATGFTDTRVPTLQGVVKETYPNSSTIAYFTNKPANGTLYFYGNDSTCASASLNDTIFDIGTAPADNNSIIQEYKLWHLAELYDDDGGRSLDYDLHSGTSYYFKIKICDENNKCGESKCSKFVTESNTNCPFCKFVSKIKVPTGWNVYYDLDQDWAYEHWQGNILFAEDGMFTNFTDGRKANILLNTSNGKAAMEFINVTLIKSGMSPKIRDVDDTADFKNGTTTTAAGATIGYVGMIEDVKDKIVNNLFPQKCRITIPKGDTDCSQLWQCNTTLGGCMNRTANATAVSNTSTTCTWQIPYCQFSTYGGGQPGTGGGGGTTSTSGGSGGGGGEAAITEIKSTDLYAGETKTVAFTKDFSLTEIVVTAKSKVSDSIKVEDITNSPSVSTPAINPVEGGVYKYLSITADKLNAVLEKAVIKFKVEKSWLSRNNFDEEKVVLKRLNSGTNLWESLATAKKSADSTYIYYSAETKSFSKFAVVGQKKAAVAAPAEAPAGEAVETAAEAPAAPPAEVRKEIVEEAAPPSKAWETVKGLSWLWVTLVIVVIGLIIYLMKKK